MFGARLECRELMLPHINWGFEEERPETPHIGLDLKFSRYDEGFLAGRRFERKELAIDESRESVYLFGAHNPVRTQWVSFSRHENGRLWGIAQIRFDFDYEDRIGGVFEHMISAPIEIEDR